MLNVRYAIFNIKYSICIVSHILRGIFIMVFIIWWHISKCSLVVACWVCKNDVQFKYFCTHDVHCKLNTPFFTRQVLSMCLCVFLKGGEKAVSDNKCHIGRDINCRSDASSRAARICKAAVLLHMCVISFCVHFVKSLSHYSHVYM